MISASTNNELIELESLLKKPLNPNVRDEHGTTPLHCAAERGHVENLQSLIEAGADKDQANDDGQTPLFVAAPEGHLDVVRHLVEVGAPTKIKPRTMGQRHCSSPQRKAILMSFVIWWKLVPTKIKP